MATSIVTPAAGDNALEQTPQAPELQTPVVPAEPESNVSPQALARQELYAKYYGQATPTEEPAVPVAEPVVETPPIPPVPAPTPGPDFVSLQQELNELKTLLQQQRTPPAPPTPPTPPVDPPTEDLPWMKKLQAGDMRGFEEELAKSMRDRLAPGIQNEAVERALTLRRVEDDIERFTDTVRKDNPELDNPAMTHLISSALEKRIAEEMSGNRITSPYQYAETYKRILNEEVQQARTFIESLRAAQTPPPAPAPNPNVRKEVLSGAGITPTALPAPGASGKPTLPPAPTAQDYLARRLAESNRGKLLS